MEKLSDNDNNIDIVYIPCDEEYNHISSSSLRNIINSGYLDKVKEYLI